MRSDGEALFDDNCAYCHTLGPRPFRTEVERVPEVLRQGGIGAHRFDLSDEELRSLVDYLRSLER